MTTEKRLGLHGDVPHDPGLEHPLEYVDTPGSLHVVRQGTPDMSCLVEEGISTKGESDVNSNFHWCSVAKQPGVVVDRFFVLVYHQK